MSEGQFIAAVSGVVLLAMCGVVWDAIRRGRNVSFWGRLGWFGFGGDVSHKPPKA